MVSAIEKFHCTWFMKISLLHSLRQSELLKTKFQVFLVENSYFPGVIHKIHRSILLKYTQQGSLMANLMKARCIWRARVRKFS